MKSNIWLIDGDINKLMDFQEFLTKHVFYLSKVLIVINNS